MRPIAWRSRRWSRRCFAFDALSHIYLNRRHLPDVGSFTRFEFPTIGCLHAKGQPPHCASHGVRTIIRYDDIPLIVARRNPSDGGQELLSPTTRGLLEHSTRASKIRVGAFVERLATGGRHDNAVAGRSSHRVDPRSPSSSCAVAFSEF